MFSGVLRAEDIIGIRKSGSGDTTVVDEQTLLEAFLNMSLRSACFNDIVFFYGKKQNFCSWDYSSQVLDCQDFQIVGC